MTGVIEKDRTMSSIDQKMKISLNGEVNQLLTIRQFCAAFPWPSESAMRSYIYRANDLGLSEAFVRVGRRVLIIPKIFFSVILQVENRLTEGESYEAATLRKRETSV